MGEPEVHESVAALPVWFAPIEKEKHKLKKLVLRAALGKEVLWGKKKNGSCLLSSRLDAEELFEATVNKIMKNRKIKS